MFHVEPRLRRSCRRLPGWFHHCVVNTKLAILGLPIGSLTLIVWAQNSLIGRVGTVEFSFFNLADSRCSRGSIPVLFHAFDACFT